MGHFKYIILSGLLIILISCGQVGTITGGPKDYNAPKVLLDEVTPPIGSVNIKPHEITIPFDEYIKFNKPSKHIRVTPDDVKLDYAIKQKSVVLTVKEGTWKPNTTYTIYLNHAVQDITEGNDSIIAYVFSTGSFLDSMQTALKVVDAYTGQPIENLTVGLYTNKLINDTSEIDPAYYASTDKNGIANFNYIKNTTFYAYAFEDENLNNRLDKNEKRAILRNPVQLLDSQQVKLPTIRLMPALDTLLTVVNNDFVQPSAWGISFNRPLKKSETLHFFQPQPKYIVWNKTKDSVTAFYHMKSNSGDVFCIVQSPHNSDTISKKYFFKSLSNTTLTSNIKNNTLGVQDTLKLTASEPIKTINKAYISLQSIQENDTIQQPLNYTLDSISPTTIRFVFSKENNRKIFLTIAPKGMIGINRPLNDSLKLNFTLQKENETGSLLIQFDTIPPYGILYVENTKAGEEYKVTFNGTTDTLAELKYLPPGKYSFRFLLDKNKDGKWSTGSIFSNQNPERVIWFNQHSTVRANWDVKIKLAIPKQKEEEEE